MHFGIKSLLAAAVFGLSGLASTAGAQDVRLVSYEELLDRVAALEEDMAAAPAADLAPLDENTDDGGYYFSMEHVFVTPYFSQNTSSIVIGPVAGNSEVREFDWDMEYSPRFEIGNINACDGTGWRARYWHFDHSQAVSGPIPAGVTVNINPNNTRPGFTGAAGDTVSANHSLRMSVLDFDYMKRDISEDGGYTVSVGMRYVRMDQHLRARRVNAAGVLLNNLSQHHDFEGIGPTVAAEFLKRFDCSYWGAFVNARGSLLYGESNLRYDNRGAAGVLANNVTDTNDQDLIKVIEMQIGLDYRRPTASCHEMFLRVALEAQYWSNAGSGSGQGFGAVGAIGDSAQDADLGFYGVTIATGLDW